MEKIQDKGTCESIEAAGGCGKRGGYGNVGVPTFISDGIRQMALPF